MKNYRKVIGILIFIVALVTMYGGGQFTVNCFAIWGFFLLVLSLIVYYWDKIKSWFKFGKAKGEGEIIEIEPWIERPETRTSIILFPKSPKR